MVNNMNILSNIKDLCLKIPKKIHAILISHKEETGLLGGKMGQPNYDLHK